MLYAVVQPRRNFPIPFGIKICLPQPQGHILFRHHRMAGVQHTSDPFAKALPQVLYDLHSVQEDAVAQTRYLRPVRLVFHSDHILDCHVHQRMLLQQEPQTLLERLAEQFIFHKVVHRQSAVNDDQDPVSPDLRAVLCQAEYISDCRVVPVLEYMFHVHHLLVRQTGHMDDFYIMCGKDLVRIMSLKRISAEQEFFREVIFYPVTSTSYFLHDLIAFQ